MYESSTLCFCDTSIACWMHNKSTQGKKHFKLSYCGGSRRLRFNGDCAKEGPELKAQRLGRPYVVTKAQPAFFHHVLGCSAAFARGQVHSPYFTLVQSSGSGKTKLVIEAARAGKVTSLYLLCRACQQSIAPPFITDLMSWVSQRMAYLAVEALKGYIVDRL